jgi:signal transduction histidine kinase
VSFVLLLSFSLIYYLSTEFIETDFYDLVKEKATLTAWKYFEKDEMSAMLYQKVMDKNVITLPDAKEIVLDTKEARKVADSLEKILPHPLVLKLLSGQTVKFRNKDTQGVGIYYPDNQGTFIIIITAVNKFGILQQKKLFNLLLLIFLGSIVLIFLLGRLYATNVLYPIANILKNVKRIRATNLSLRLKENTRNDELAELTRTFNQMLDRLENSFTLQKNFIHNASHELKNPLTAILGEAEVALNRQRTANDYIVTIGKIKAEAERLNLLTRNLLSLAQTESDLTANQKDEIRMDEFIWEIKEDFDKTNYQGRLEIHYPVLPETSNLITIQGNSDLLKIALTNLIENACKFSAPQKVDVTLETGPACIHIQVTDKGIGIPEPEISSLFQPFFRASNATAFNGSGIGLSLVQKIITLHNGEIKINSIIGKGTKVDVIFPLL